MSDPIRPIRPELLAAKIEKIENFEQPRLLEEFSRNPKLVRALWFLQWVSQSANYPGGLSKFSEELISASGDRMGTAHMLKVEAKDRYAAKDAVAIFRELPADERSELFGAETWLFEDEFLSDPESEKWEDWTNTYDDPPLLREKRRRDRMRKLAEFRRKDCNSLLVSKMTPSSLRSMLSDIARDNLADYFKQLCELPHVGFLPCDRNEGHGAPWFFANIAEALLAFIDSRAQQVRSRLAETEITKEIKRWLAKSRSMQKSVFFIGNSRFGKSETIKLEAKADPGTYRLVETPRGNAISDLVREVAKTYGLEFGPGTTVRELCERIDYVRRFSHLQLIFDEAQMLLPASYSRNTEPARLNWVRRSIMDQGSLVVFVCTPQSYDLAKKRFVKKTGFAMEQFDERIYRVELREKPEEADLLAVGRFHFEDLDEKRLRYVLEKVLAAERNFVSDMEKIATLAKDNAREHGRKKPTLADIDAAMAIVLPRAEPDLPAKKAQPKPSIQRPCKTAAEPLPMPRRGLEILNRDRSIGPAEVPA